MTWRTKLISEWGVVEQIQLTVAIQSLKEARIEMEGNKASIEQDDSDHLIEKYKDVSNEELDMKILEFAEQIIKAKNGV